MTKGRIKQIFKDRGVKTNDGSFVFVGRSRLLQPVRHTKNKVNRVRRNS